MHVLDQANSDTVKIAIVNGFMTLFGTIVSGVIVVLLAKINKKAKDAAEAATEVKDKVEEVKTTAKAMFDQTLTKISDAKVQLDAIQTTGETTRQYVNGAMTKQLRLVAVTLRRIAEITKNKHDITVAEEAEVAADLREKNENACKI